MNQIIAIRYADAFYSEEKNLTSSKLITHYSVGKIAATSKDFIAISFTEKNNIPWRGLLLPREAIVFKKNNKISELASVKNKIKKIKKNTPIGIFWKDLVYFENGVLPPSYSLMYTEGKVHFITPKAIIIKDPETIKIAPKKNTQHPKRKTNLSFLIIPRFLITDIEIYGK
jgi:hypothetical protein